MRWYYSAVDIGWLGMQGDPVSRLGGKISSRQKTTSQCVKPSFRIFFSLFFCTCTAFVSGRCLLSICFWCTGNFSFTSHMHTCAFCGSLKQIYTVCTFSTWQPTSFPGQVFKRRQNRGQLFGFIVLYRVVYYIFSFLNTFH